MKWTDSSIKFTDAELPNIYMFVSKDDDVAGSFKFHIGTGPDHSFFILSAHDRQRLIQLLERGLADES